MRALSDARMRVGTNRVPRASLPARRDDQAVGDVNQEGTTLGVKFQLVPARAEWGNLAYKPSSTF